MTPVKGVSPVMSSWLNKHAITERDTSKGFSEPPLPLYDGQDSTLTSLLLAG